VERGQSAGRKGTSNTLFSSMVVPRATPSHRIRRWASGPTRPTKGTTYSQRLLPQPQSAQPLSTLARYFAEFDPYQEVLQDVLDAVPELRFRSAPWDDVLDDDTECLKSSRTQSLEIYFSVMANDRHPWLHATHAGNVAEDC
jgi:hypothetical protein